MELSPALKEAYTKEHLSAKEAQQRAEWIAFGPIVFEASRLMVKYGILDLLRDSDNGMTMEELAQKTGLSRYAVKVLLEASLCIGTVLVDEEALTDAQRQRPYSEAHFTLSKTGWFLLNDPATRVNMDFNHDVNYEGWFHLDEALQEGKPAGLRHFGAWPTVYQGLSQLPPQVQKSWFAFDHFYSDSSFDEALAIIFDKGVSPRGTQRLLDIGGNTGRWALRCVQHNPKVQVTIVDLPQQLQMMRHYVSGKEGSERINGVGCDLLNVHSHLPSDNHYDVIWMSQFLDCFSEEEIVSILHRVVEIMDADSRVCIMETFWNRQRFVPGAFCLTMTSLYFTAIANGNSKMYHSEDMERLVNAAGLAVDVIHDNLGQGHSIMVCKLL